MIRKLSNENLDNTYGAVIIKDILPMENGQYRIQYLVYRDADFALDKRDYSRNEVLGVHNNYLDAVRTAI